MKKKLKILKTLFLEDLKDCKSQKEVKEHIIENYNDYGDNNGKIALKNKLKNFIIIIAYESVGNWGCDSSSFFLLKNKLDGKYYEVSGSHCSCYGFEGQFEPAESDLKYLKSDKFYFCTGGYDSDEETNKKSVYYFIKTCLF